jgi:Zn-dependent M28 family amino/carboxypeptidase
LIDTYTQNHRREKEINIDNSELVFAGYGIVAPEYNWNDYEGIDVEGKTVVLLVNDPGFATRNDSLFTGKAMTYYGRWTYKYEEAASQGAEAALIVHEEEPAGYGWGVVSSSWSGTQYRLAGGDASYLKAEGWIHLDAAKKLFADAGTSLEKAKEKAIQRGFKAEPMNLNASVSFNQNFEELESYNVAGYLEGSEYPNETVLYMAHWDHLGKVEKDRRSRYHQPSDTIHDMWSYDGIHQDLWLFFNIGKDLANSDDFPGWTKDSEFKDIREETANKRQR